MPVFTINIWFITINIFVVNWFQWHKKLQHLFRGALYNKCKYKKCAVPFRGCILNTSISSYQLMGQIS